MTRPGPSVSAVIITYNGERYLSAQLESILSQTRPPDEIVLSDDASTDGTLDCARAVLASWHGQLRIRTSPTTRGVSANLQSALEIASGDLLFLCDQDDVWSPRRVARQVDLIESDRSVVGTFCDALLIDAQGRATGELLWKRVRFTGRRRRAWSREPASVLLGGSVVTGATLAFRRELLDLVLPFPDCGWHDSWIALLAAFSGAKVLALPEALMSYRLHGDNAAGVPWRTWHSRLGAARWPEPRTLVFWSEAIERLKARAPESSRDGVERLERACAFHARRAGLDPRIWRRGAPVMFWWMTGEYSRWGSGGRTAAADLAVAALGWTEESAATTR